MRLGGPGLTRLLSGLFCLLATPGVQRRRWQSKGAALVAKLAMEQHLGSVCECILSLSTNDKRLNLRALASARSLIINSSTSDSTISALFETLTRFLQLTTEPRALHHTLKLLSDIAFHHSRLSGLVFHSVRSYLLRSDSTRLSAESLAVLSSIAEHDRSLASAMDELDDRFFVSLCFGPSVSVRSWFLSNAFRFPIRPYVLLTVMLGFTKDPYPYVRRVALDGLVGLSKSSVIEDCGVIEGCYCRAVELLGDAEDSVRCAAVHAVRYWLPESSFL